MIGIKTLKVFIKLSKKVPVPLLVKVLDTTTGTLYVILVDRPD